MSAPFIPTTSAAEETLGRLANIRREIARQREEKATDEMRVTRTQENIDALTTLEQSYIGLLEDAGVHIPSGSKPAFPLCG